IHFEGVDSFIEIGKPQNTVFLRCNIPSIEQVWDKPDFAGVIRPHLTLYDGKDRTQANLLLRTTRQYRLRFVTRSTPIIQIKAKSKAAEIEEFTVHQAIYDEILDRRIDYQILQNKLWRERLPYFEEVARFIETYYG
ncbi:hypothetical protein, partial [Bradyrhizobium sp. P5_C12]